MCASRSKRAEPRSGVIGADLPVLAVRPGRSAPTRLWPVARRCRGRSKIDPNSLQTNEKTVLWTTSALRLASWVFVRRMLRKPMGKRASFNDLAPCSRGYLDRPDLRGLGAVHRIGPHKGDAGGVGAPSKCKVVVLGILKQLSALRSIGPHQPKLSTGRPLSLIERLAAEGDPPAIGRDLDLVRCGTSRGTPAQRWAGRDPGGSQDSLNRTSETGLVRGAPVVQSHNRALMEGGVPSNHGNTGERT